MRDNGLNVGTALVCSPALEPSEVFCGLHMDHQNVDVKETASYFLEIERERERKEGRKEGRRKREERKKEKKEKGGERGFFRIS